MALKNSIVKNTRSAKFSRLSGALAISTAKKNNDPNVAKMIKYKNLWKKYKDKVQQRFGAKGRLAARSSLS